jgi:hypothetical protein
MPAANVSVRRGAREAGGRRHLYGLACHPGYFERGT